MIQGLGIAIGLEHMEIGGASIVPHSGLGISSHDHANLDGRYHIYHVVGESRLLSGASAMVSHSLSFRELSRACLPAIGHTGPNCAWEKSESLSVGPTRTYGGCRGGYCIYGGGAPENSNPICQSVWLDVVCTVGKAPISL